MSGASDGRSDRSDASRVGEGLLDEEMGPSSSMAHLYRGEVHRMQYWRDRLDKSTYWAVTVLAAVLTWSFSSPSNPHYVLLVGGSLVGVFTVVEARRFRGYDIWRSRVRLLQRNVFAPGLDPDREVPDPNWRAQLGADYHRPRAKITYEEAFAHRLRRVYLPLFVVLALAWAVRVAVLAQRPWPASAAIGPVSGVAVTAGVALVVAALAVVALRPRQWAVEREIHGRASDWEEELRES